MNNNTLIRVPLHRNNGKTVLIFRVFFFGGIICVEYYVIHRGMRARSCCEKRGSSGEGKCHVLDTSLNGLSLTMYGVTVLIIYLR